MSARTAIANAPPPSDPNATFQLTAKQTALLEQVIDHGHKVADAGTIAGYGSPRAAYSAWQRMKRSGAVAHALRERLSDASVIAYRTLVDLAESAEREDVKLNAAKDLLNRAGFGTGGDAAAQHGGITVVIDLG